MMKLLECLKNINHSLKVSMQMISVFTLFLKIFTLIGICISRDASRGNFMRMLEVTRGKTRQAPPSSLVP